jgi:hypothetical protein
MAEQKIRKPRVTRSIRLGGYPLAPLMLAPIPITALETAATPDRVRPHILLTLLSQQRRFDFSLGLQHIRTLVAQAWALLPWLEGQRRSDH